ncbi:DUF2721 domain-containing protein [Pacificimonas flava]|uniref:DUF2721 domain-containing protein n=1 Tax=Pacificimonas flava TaxID=1234595 RepID=M2SG75_9SPHN|nr:DUF2721 domain-containing protein [Pacificimonas flava]EMD84355.1 hypothetical protein C725_0285 [Pacificimonas flava]MBB5279770.1 small-conductance mechanosensitive channel [Pacificimonas flava]
MMSPKPILERVAESTAEVALRTADTQGIGQLVDGALAPVFLIAGIGALLNVLTSRLARVVSRARDLEKQFASLNDDARQRALAELPLLDKRIALTHSAIYCCVASALAIALVVALLFVGAFVEIPLLGTLIAALFVLAMLLIVVGLVYFLRETRISIRSLRVRRELMEDSRSPALSAAAGPRLREAGARTLGPDTGASDRA